MTATFNRSVIRLLPTVVTVKGGPHNIAWTHPDVVNPALLDFLKK